MSTVSQLLEDGIPVNVSTQIQGVDEIAALVARLEKFVIVGVVVAVALVVWSKKK